MKKQIRSMSILLTAIVLVWTGNVTFAVDVSSGNRDLDSSAGVYNNLTADDDAIIVRTVDGVGIYDWNDKNGDGTPGDSATPHLILGNRKLFTNNGNTTTRSSFTLYLNGGSITGSTAAGVIALDTFNTGGGNLMGHISIYGVSNILIGKIRTADDSTVQYHGSGGNVTIGTNDAPAGDIQIGGIDTHADAYAGSNDKPAGDVTIYSSGNVYIKNDAGPQSIRSSMARRNSGAGSRCGQISIYHHGSLIANVLDNGSYKTSTSAARDIVLNGAWGDGVPTGTASLGSIITSSTSINSGDAGNVQVSGYTGLTVTGDIFTAVQGYQYGNVTITNIGTGGVSVRDILTYGANVGSSYNYGGGDVIITNVQGPVTVRNVYTYSINPGTGKKAGDLSVIADGNISIGDVNLSAPTTTQTGSLRLKSTAGSITVNWLNCNWFKLPSTGYVFEGASPSRILYALVNVDKTNNPVTRLSAPTGHTVYYDATLSANAYLGSQTYNLTGGGQLVPWTGSPAWTDYYYTATSGDWDTAANWNPNSAYPQGADIARIDATLTEGTSHMCTLDADAAANHLVVRGDGSETATLALNGRTLTLGRAGGVTVGSLNYVAGIVGAGGSVTPGTGGLVEVYDGVDFGASEPLKFVVENGGYFAGTFRCKAKNGITYPPVLIFKDGATAGALTVGTDEPNDLTDYRAAVVINSAPVSAGLNVTLCCTYYVWPRAPDANRAYLYWSGENVSPQNLTLVTRTTNASGLWLFGAEVASPGPGAATFSLGSGCGTLTLAASSRTTGGLWFVVMGQSVADTDPSRYAAMTDANFPNRANLVLNCITQNWQRQTIYAYDVTITNSDLRLDVLNCNGKLKVVGTSRVGGDDTGGSGNTTLDITAQDDSVVDSGATLGSYSGRTDTWLRMTVSAGKRMDIYGTLCAALGAGSPSPQNNLAFQGNGEFVLKAGSRVAKQVVGTNHYDQTIWIGGGDNHATKLTVEAGAVLEGLDTEADGMPDLTVLAYPSWAGGVWKKLYWLQDYEDWSFKKGSITDEAFTNSVNIYRNYVLKRLGLCQQNNQYYAQLELYGHMLTREIYFFTSPGVLNLKGAHTGIYVYCNETDLETLRQRIVAGRVKKEGSALTDADVSLVWRNGTLQWNGLNNPVSGSGMGILLIGEMFGRVSRGTVFMVE